jgi:hypothetical protein
MATPSALTDVALDSKEDFTTKTYRQLLGLAKKSYDFCLYNDIPWGQKFVVWRHDCDLSLNRAYALAKIEAEEGICATYFVNPHCEFYNIFEKSQHALVLGILDMGHEIGLHYDAAFFGSSDEGVLNRHVSEEASILERLYGVRPTVFSFHNPSLENLMCQAESYGGLINCYSKKFRDNVPYCSDSNGYWRHRRLDDVLRGASDSCLQVLTHPDWWQDNVMPPRQRIFRSVYGRAASVMKKNDALLDAFDRQNHAGASGCLGFLKELNPYLFGLCDFLWNAKYLPTLFVEISKWFEGQVHLLCQEWKCKQGKVNLSESSAISGVSVASLQHHNLIENSPDTGLRRIKIINGSTCREWLSLRDELLNGGVSIPLEKLEEGCIYICGQMEILANWGIDVLNYSGLTHNDEPFPLISYSLNRGRPTDPSEHNNEILTIIGFMIESETTEVRVDGVAKDFL